MRSPCCALRRRVLFVVFVAVASGVSARSASAVPDVSGGWQRPADLTKLVHLVPADEPQETPWSPARERHELQTSLHLPVPAASGAATTSDDSCDSGVPLVGDAIDVACDVGSWLGNTAGAAID